jgi:glutathionylspermidine synthase
MKRKTIAVPRKNWQKEMESVGFTYHTIDGEKYWTEDAYYEFTTAQIEKIESVTKELSDMCFNAVQYVIDHNLFDKLKLSPESAELIRRYWDVDAPTLYGRFDLGWNGVGEPKMYEYNADTPTSLMEASIAQYYWKQAYFPEADQYNSIHETLTEQFKFIRDTHMPVNPVMYFSCVTDSDEDTRTTYYLRDVAAEAGIESHFIAIQDIGHHGTRQCFTDLDENPIEYMFKLYPWEWMENEDFAEFAFRDMKMWLEPVWKMVLSNKAILPILWKMYPNHPNLLEAYFDEEGEPKIVGEFVRKPIYSREGANIELHIGGNSPVYETDGEYGEEGHIIQGLYLLPNFGTDEAPLYPVIGSWVVGDTPCGMGIREDNSPITKNTSHFLPHIFR